MAWDNRYYFVCPSIPSFSGISCCFFNGDCPPHIFPCSQLHSDGYHRNSHGNSLWPNPVVRIHWAKNGSWPKLAYQNAINGNLESELSSSAPPRCLMGERFKLRHYWWPLLPYGWRSKQNWSRVQENDEPIPKITVWTRGIPDGKESLAPAIHRDLDTYNVPRIPQDLYSIVTFLLELFWVGFLWLKS